MNHADTEPTLPTITAEFGQSSLREHIVMKATQARLLRGGLLDRAVMMQVLNDRTVVRYPIGVRFDAQPLCDGEFACLEALGVHPSDGFCLFIHPAFTDADELLPLLIAYYIPSVNYGEIASHSEAELFGATLLGFTVDEYYALLCRAADSLLA